MSRLSIAAQDLKNVPYLYANLTNIRVQHARYVYHSCIFLHSQDFAIRMEHSKPYVKASISSCTMWVCCFSPSSRLTSCVVSCRPIRLSTVSSVWHLMWVMMRHREPSITPPSPQLCTERATCKRATSNATLSLFVSFLSTHLLLLCYFATRIFFYIKVLAGAVVLFVTTVEALIFPPSRGRMLCSF